MVVFFSSAGAQACPRPCGALEGGESQFPVKHASRANPLSPRPPVWQLSQEFAGNISYLSLSNMCRRRRRAIPKWRKGREEKGLILIFDLCRMKEKENRHLAELNYSQDQKSQFSQRFYFFIIIIFRTRNTRAPPSIEPLATSSGSKCNSL